MKIEYIGFCNILLLLSYLRLFLSDFFAKKWKIEKIQFLRDWPYFSKKTSICSPDGEPDMVLR